MTHDSPRGQIGEASSTARKVLWVVSVLLVLVLALTLLLRTEHTRSSVTVFIDAVPVDCTGTDVGSGSIDLQPQVIDLVPIEPAMSCILRFFVFNGTGHAVTVESIAIPVLGPDGGPGIVAVRLNPETALDTSPNAGQIDAIWDRNDTVMPGETQTYEATIEYRPGGCTAVGGTLLFGMPTVTVRTWFVHVTVGGGFLPVGFVGTDATAC